MRRILFSLVLLLLVSGCGEDNSVLTCTANRNTNGLRADTEYEIEYKGDDVKFVTITYDYNQDEDVNTDTANNNEEMDGVNASTDGTTRDNDDNNDSRLNSDEVVDGAVGDTIDGVVDGVTDTILDLAGIRDKFDNQMSSYDNVEGFSYEIVENKDNKYKVIYKIDFDKISDSDLSRFNIDRDFKTARSTYEDLGYTCK